MAGNLPDINAALVRKTKELSFESKEVFRENYRKAPLMLALLKFTEEQTQEKFRTADAVYYLYRIKNSHADYTLYENRFFKLRKKFYDYFHSTSAAPVSAVFTQEEIELQEIKSLIFNGNHAEAGALLLALEKRLWKDNIFELLPTVLELIIYNNQLQRRSDENETVYARMDIAHAVFADLSEAKKLARQIYDINLTKGITHTAPQFLKLQRLSINRKDYPRFKLIYNLISATCKLAGGGLDFKPDFKITNRFISVIHKIHTQHPNMPDYLFIAGYTDSQNYQFMNLQVMNYFNSFQFKEASNVLSKIVNLVLAPDSRIKRMRGPFLFSSTCLVFTLGERYHDALEAANNFLHYAREIKKENELLKAYLEIANAHTWLYPIKSGYNNAFVAGKIEEYIHSVGKGEYRNYFLGLANWMKVKLLLVTEDFAKAQTVFSKNDFSAYLMDPYLLKGSADTISLLASAEFNRKKAELHLRDLQTLRLRTKYPPDYQNYMFLEKLLRHKLK